MGRWSFVVVVVVVVQVVSTAAARADDRCWRRWSEIAILPAPGARDVPRSTGLWLLGAEPGRWEVTGSDAPWIGTGTAVAHDRAATTVQRFDIPEPPSPPTLEGLGIEHAWDDPETGPRLMPVPAPGLHGGDQAPRDAAEVSATFPWRATGVGVCVAVVAMLNVLLFRHFRRTSAVRRATPTPVSLLIVEQLARAVQRRSGVIAAVGIVGVPALVVTKLGPLAILSTIVGCIGVRGFSIARAALRLIEGGDGRVTAEAIAHVLVVRTTAEEVRLEVAPGALTAARRRAIPHSIVKR